MEPLGIFAGESRIEIHPIAQDELDGVLAVYSQCEDFLALGPVPTASLQMVLDDLAASRKAGGVYCGIYNAAEEMVGVVDYVPCGYAGEPEAAYLALLMIAAPYRSQGIGKAVVERVEAEIMHNPQVTAILAGVQVNNPRALRFWQRNGYRITGPPELYPDQTSAYPLRRDLTYPLDQGDSRSAG